ncbi:MAG TPA: aminopeptidase P family protein [Verrucomicrobiales bacterium]|nr:aminopeptidase P family protein [Verrucomicrobiales bacterium]
MAAKKSKPKKNVSPDVLIIADSDHNADMLYAAGMFAPDPFIYLRRKGREYLCMSDLEFDRAKKEAPHCEILSLSKIQSALQRQGVKHPGWGEVAAWMLKKYRIKSIQVPEAFPLQMARRIGEYSPETVLNPSEVFPERLIKTPREIRYLQEALRMTEIGLQVAVRTLKQSKINQKKILTFQGKPLSSEKLRAVIHTAICQEGGLASNTIVAGGNQACDPHNRGSGILMAHQAIILDIFPRSESTGFFGDMTRTVVRGKASDGVKKQYAAVQEAQQHAINITKDGVSGLGVHEAVEGVFRKHDFPTKRINGQMSGFYHGTGHGLGLEIHEWPRMGKTSTDTLKSGNVMTVEPGLYYYGVGGVRLEDVIVVRSGKARVLTSFEKVLEI